MFGRRFFEFEPHSRLFEKGDLKYIILDLLKDKPGHGYGIIRALGERFHGFYSPSAGSVYPTLQLLEDMGYVSSSEQDGKKVYTITEEGRRFLKEREETIDKIKGHMHDWWGAGKREEFHETMHEFWGLALLLRRKSRQLNPDKLARIREIISRARHDIENILEQEN
jgi:DNA-binding PadR family transcriptional regulator